MRRPSGRTAILRTYPSSISWTTDRVFEARDPHAAIKPQRDDSLAVRKELRMHKVLPRGWERSATDRPYVDPNPRKHLATGQSRHHFCGPSRPATHRRRPTSSLPEQNSAKPHDARLHRNRAGQAAPRSVLPAAKRRPSAKPARCTPAKSPPLRLLACRARRRCQSPIGKPAVVTAADSGEWADLRER